MLKELIYIIIYYIAFSSFGIIGFTVLGKIFKFKKLEKLYIISKPFGLILFGFFIWLLASLHLIKSSSFVIVFTLFTAALILSVYYLFKENKQKRQILNY